MNNTDSHSSKTLTLYVRSLASADSIAYLDAIFDRVDRLEASGRIAEYSVEVWGRHVRSASTTRTTVGQDIRSTLGTFWAWAERSGMSLDSFFTTKEVEISYSDESYTVMVLPILTLAEYDGDDLTFVAPCATDDTVHTVHRRLDVLDTTENKPPTGRAPSPSRLTPEGGPGA